MKIKYYGRCSVTPCPWRFSSSSLALITELYGNHCKGSHNASGTLLVEPGPLVIPWPPHEQQLMDLKLSESPERSRARAVKRLVLASVGSLAAAVGMFLVALMMAANGAFVPGIAALGGPAFWIGFFVPELLLSSGVAICSLRVSRSPASLSFRRFGFLLLILTLAVSVVVGGLLWFGLIGIADIATAGEVPTSFSDLYLLQILLAILSVVGLVASIAAFSGATSARPTSSRSAT